MSSKQRLSASVDQELVAAGHEVVSAGRAASFSAWVNDALQAQVERDHKLAAIDAFLRDFEAEHGEITEAEIAAATRNARTRATVIRGR